MVFVLISTLIALAGLALIGDFLLWQFIGQVVPGTIDDFNAERQGRPKPVMTYSTLDGQKMKEIARRVTHINYLLGNPQKGDVFNVIYEKNNPAHVRVSGYLHIVAGAMMTLPLFASVAYRFGQGILTEQVEYMFLMVVILVGGWLGLKLLRRSY